MDAVENCQNCRRPFPQQKIDSHFAYCRRNIRKCQHCDDMIDINHLEEHMEDVHTKQACPYCKQEMDTKNIAVHKKQCDRRPVVCAYCEQSVPSKTFEEHQWECGSRTKTCALCQKGILLREYDVHEATCQGLPNPATVRAYENYNGYIKKQREHFGLQPKEQIKPPKPIQRVRITSNDYQKNKSGEANMMKHQIKEIGSRVVYVSKPRPLNIQDADYQYEPRSATVIRTTVTTSYVSGPVQVTQQSSQQPNIGFQEEDAELQRALLQSMGHM